MPVRTLARTQAGRQDPVLSPVVLSLSPALYAAHASPGSTRRDPHIQSTTYTLAHLGVTDNRIKLQQILFTN